VFRFDRVAKRQLAVDLVVRSAPVSTPRDHARFLELAENPLHRAFGNPNGLGDLAHANVRITGDTDQYVTVITEETPGWGAWVDAHGSITVFSYIKHKSCIDKREKIIMLHES